MTKQRCLQCFYAQCSLAGMDFLLRGFQSKYLAESECSQLPFLLVHRSNGSFSCVCVCVSLALPPSYGEIDPLGAVALFRITSTFLIIVSFPCFIHPRKLPYDVVPPARPPPPPPKRISNSRHPHGTTTTMPRGAKYLPSSLDHNIVRFSHCRLPALIPLRTP